MLKEWLLGMLANRGCSRPDGRWLYAYRLLSSEYDSLRECLCEATRTTGVSPLARRNKYFAPLFVLYAAEWWRREYDGGPWKWGPILASLQVEKDELPPNERSGAVLEGFAFWGLRPASEGKRYFGAVVAHGGLPLKLIGHGGSRLAAVMGTVLRQAARYGWGESQVVDAVADHAPAMPESLRRDEVFRLLASMVLTTLDLKARHQLGGVLDPIERLDNADPDWREEYPLQIDDSAAVQLLTSMVKVASQASTEQGAVAVFQVVRSLSYSDLGEWRLESRVVHPAVASADALAQQFGLGTASALPRYFEVDVTVGERGALTSGRLLLGSDRATVTFGIQRRRWSGRVACDEHILHLRTAGNDVVEGGVALPGGESLADIDGPWVFVAEGERYRLAGAGDLRLPDAEALVAVAEGSILESLEESASGSELLGQLHVDSGKTLVLWRVSGSVQISDTNDSWKVRLGQTRKLSGSLVLEGRRAAYASRPWPVFRGKPHVVRYDDEGARVVLSKGLHWFAAGSRSQIDPARYCGPVELQVFEDDERIGRFRFILVSAHSSERFLSGTSAEDASVEFTGWGFADLAVESGRAEIGAFRKTAQGHAVTLQVLSTPPKDVLVHLRWPESPHELRVWVPFPASGGRAFDVEGTPVVSGSVMSLRHAAGVRILVFDQNPDQPKKYEVELELRGDPVLGRSDSSLSRRMVPIVKGFAEVRLLDLYGEIEALLSLSSELDARVELRLMVGGKRNFSMSVSRYDVALRPKVMGIALEDEDLRRVQLEQVQGCEVLASPILRPAEAPRVLSQSMSEGAPSGVWSIEGLRPEFAPWLVYPAPGSALEFRPLCIGGGFASEDDAATADPLPACALAVAIRLPDAAARLAAIDAVLVAMGDDFDHDSWSMLDGLWSAFGRLPLCSIDTFKVLATRPEVVVAMLFRSELPAAQLGGYVRELKRQLGMTLELVGITVWRRAIEKFSHAWTKRLGDDLAKLSVPILLKDRLKAVVDELPALQLNMEWLQFECLNEYPPAVLQLQKDIAANRGVHITRLWQGEDSFLQRLLLRVHADDVAWPEARFFKDKAIRAFGDAVLRIPSLNKQLKLLESFFWLENGDFKLSVANVPVLCALWCALDLPLDWWRDAGSRLAMQRLRAFDPQWFEEAYRHAFAASIGLGLIEPAPARLSRAAPLIEGGPRVHRVPAGTVQRIKEKTN